MQARILIIEDVKEMADLIRLYLQKEGMDATICESAEDGLARFTQTRFDLVVLDINLPGIDGFEFLQRLRKSSFTFDDFLEQIQQVRKMGSLSSLLGMIWAGAAWAAA